MWESPIKITEDITRQVDMEIENGIMTAVRKVGIDVNKEELLKALQYDRGQYEKGYQDGLNANKWIPCSESLPDDFMSYEYLTIRKGQTLATITYYCVVNHKWYSNRKSTKEIDVIAWMPLPEPYKGE